MPRVPWGGTSGRVGRHRGGPANLPDGRALFRPGRSGVVPGCLRTGCWFLWVAGDGPVCESIVARAAPPRVGEGGRVSGGTGDRALGVAGSPGSLQGSSSGRVGAVCRCLRGDRRGLGTWNRGRGFPRGEAVPGSPVRFRIGFPFFLFTRRAECNVPDLALLLLEGVRSGTRRRCGAGTYVQAAGGIGLGTRRTTPVRASARLACAGVVRPVC